MLDLEWQDDEYGKARRALYFHRIYVGMIDDFTGRWRGWVQTSPDMNLVGTFATDTGARRAVEAAVAKALED